MTEEQETDVMFEGVTCPECGYYPAWEVHVLGYKGWSWMVECGRCDRYYELPEEGGMSDDNVL